MTQKIILPWPEPVLNPNVRAHWAPYNRAAQKAKEYAYYATLEAKPEVPEGRMIVRMLGRPPRKRYPDKDNFSQSLKSARDGIALALGVNDTRFDPIVEWGEPDRPSGSVTITIEPA